jgi:prepilin-type N-terminal cleavage/methylation domain-containing protein
LYLTNSGIYSTVADRRHVRLWSKGTMKKKRKGFTLAELLIVVAIIAVLVAIGIPIFTSQLEKSREATDAANIRVQYAQVMAEAITVDGNVNIDGKDFEKINLRQKQPDWQTETIPNSLGNFSVIEGIPGTQAWVEYHADTETVYIKFEGESQNGDSDSNGENNILIDSSSWDSTSGWEVINVKFENGKAILTPFSHKDSVLKQGGDGTIMLQANKKYKLVVNIEECGANLKVRLSNRNGNNTYLEQNIQKLGKYEFDYTHEEGRDDDVRISFEIPKGQEGKDSVCITSVSFIQVNN